MGDLRKVAALWKREGKNGTFYAGKIDAEAMTSALAGSEVSLLLFKVKNPKERGPALELFCAPERERGTRRETPSNDEGSW